MTYNIGSNCELILDNQGYFVQPGSYKVSQPRIRRATIRADGSEAYVDLGPGKRVWSMTILCTNDLLCFDGTSTGLTGQNYRDALRASYTGSVGTTLTFSDPLNNNIQVHLDHYEEHITDLKTQAIALATGGSLAASYLVSIVLVEA